MPVMDGHELAGRLRDAAKDRPLLLVAATARSTDADRDRSTGAGFHAHLVKPVELNTLLAAMSDFAQSRWEQRERPAAAPEPVANGS